MDKEVWVLIGYLTSKPAIFGIFSTKELAEEAQADDEELYPMKLNERDTLYLVE